MVIDEWNNVSFQTLINKGLNGSPLKISQFNLATFNFKRAKMFIDSVAILTFMLCFHQGQVLSYHQSILNEMEPSDKRTELTLLFSNEKRIHSNLLDKLKEHQIEQPGDRLNIKNQQLDERMKYYNEEFNNIRLKWNDLMSQKLTTLFISQTETPSQQFEEIVSTISCSHSPSIKNKVDDNSNCNQISTIKMILATRFILHRFRLIHSKNKKDYNKRNDQKSKQEFIENNIISVENQKSELSIDDNVEPSIKLLKIKSKSRTRIKKYYKTV
ncbi:hypothetical protein BLOT_007673 [Blomia tropicalis]|nr:hypothetical protein BLOT_007673 [Blomia tropicalis]